MDTADRVCANLAQRIIELRKLRKWSQEHLAERARIDARNLRRIEADGNARVWTLARIAEALEVSLSALFQAPRGRYERRPGRPATPGRRGKAADAR